MSTRTTGHLKPMNATEALLWLERRTMEHLDRFEIQTDGVDLFIVRLYPDRSSHGWIHGSGKTLAQAVAWVADGVDERDAQIREVKDVVDEPGGSTTLRVGPRLPNEPDFVPNDEGDA